MPAVRIVLLLLILCLGFPAQAARDLQWQQCDTARPAKCRPVAPEQIRWTTPVTTLATTVQIALSAVDVPLAIDIDAMASATVRWNGVVIGRNGIPGPSRASETPGRYSASLRVPPRLVRPGANRVAITLSAHHLWLPVDQPVHRLAIGPPQDASAYTIRHYLPTLATLALPFAALLLLSALRLAGRGEGVGLLPIAILATVVAQGLLEVSKLAFAYSYPWHLARLVALTGLTAIVGLLLVALACRTVSSSRSGSAVTATAAAMLIACIFVQGFDRQACAVFEVALFASAVVAAPAAMGRDRPALALAATALLLLAWAHSAGPDFLDTGYYLAAAGAALGLGAAAILQPARVVEVPAPAAEPTVTLRDGARYHVLAPSEIICLKADDDYCTIHMRDGRTILVTMTLKTVLATLPSDFLRIHRSHAINARHLCGAKPGRSSQIAEMTDGRTLPVGRTYAAALKALLSREETA